MSGTNVQDEVLSFPLTQKMRHGSFVQHRETEGRNCVMMKYQGNRTSSKAREVRLPSILSKPDIEDGTTTLARFEGKIILTSS